MHIRRTALVGAAMLALLTAVPAHAAAAPPVRGAHRPDGVVDPGVLRRQAALERLADAITGVPGHRRATVPGYAGHTIDPQQGLLTLYWHGDVPKRITDLLEHTPPGITATVRQTPYTLWQLREARDRLVEAAIRGDADAVWNAAGPAADGTGLSVTYTPDSYTPGTDRRHRSLTGEQVATHAAELAGVPVDAAPSVALMATATRHSDASPWSAGAELTAPGNAFCTSGFGPWRGRTAVLLTAAHCGTSGTYKTGTGTEIGAASDSDIGLDITVINTNGGPSGRFYDGAWDNPSGYSKRVVGAGHNSVGGLVCDSGAMSGVHCGLKVTKTEYAASVEGTWHKDMDVAERTDGSTIAVAQGDRGGPVFASVTGGEDMQARGSIVAGGGQKAVCSPTSTRTTCYDTVLYTPISPVVDRFGLSLA
ncbi:S1 family peptidase [Kitasatospora aureofaciens]|uniref:S1 family peptidase n=1 Tax=Kitasatospora aureofaciens TaxID=1894 RepID=UPI001C45E087|nr:S1 family peptidase [Kitasatospora aureofaciens]MBV6695512.1 S1 family peptidase [Kitasatospora aureofaciens]